MNHPLLEIIVVVINDWFQPEMSTLLSLSGMWQKIFLPCRNEYSTRVGAHLIISMIVFFSTIFVT